MIRVPIPNFQLYFLFQDDCGNNIMVAGNASRQLGYFGQATTIGVSIEVPPLWLKPGLYSAFWKVIGAGLYPGQQRFLSDPIPVQIVGEVDYSSSLGILAPNLRWKAKIDGELHGEG